MIQPMSYQDFMEYTPYEQYKVYKKEIKHINEIEKDRAKLNYALGVLCGRLDMSIEQLNNLLDNIKIK